MIKIDDLHPSAKARGKLPDRLPSVARAQWHGPEAVELTYSAAVQEPGAPTA